MRTTAPALQLAVEWCQQPGRDDIGERPQAGLALARRTAWAFLQLLETQPFLSASKWAATNSNTRTTAGEVRMGRFLVGGALTTACNSADPEDAGASSPRTVHF